MLSFFDGNIEITPQWVNESWKVSSLIDGADVIGGLRFVSLRQVLAYKRFLKRTKDLNDIAALETYLFGDHPSVSECSN